jgi:hypothetical protein
LERQDAPRFGAHEAFASAAPPIMASASSSMKTAELRLLRAVSGLFAATLREPHNGFNDRNDPGTTDNRWKQAQFS